MNLRLDYFLGSAKAVCKSPEAYSKFVKRNSNKIAEYVYDKKAYLTAAERFAIRDFINQDIKCNLAREKFLSK